MSPERTRETAQEQNPLQQGEVLSPQNAPTGRFESFIPLKNRIDNIDKKLRTVAKTTLVAGLAISGGASTFEHAEAHDLSNIGTFASGLDPFTLPDDATIFRMASTQEATVHSEKHGTNHHKKDKGKKHKGHNGKAKNEPQQASEPYELTAIVVEPSDATNVPPTFDQDVEGAFNNAEGWLLQNTGHVFSLNTDGDHLHIDHLRLTETDAEVRAYGPGQLQFLADKVYAAGLVNDHQIGNIFYLGGNDSSCANALGFPTPKHVVGYYVKAEYTSSAGKAIDCSTKPLAGTPNEFYWPFVIIHENTHEAGAAVANGSPDSIGTDTAHVKQKDDVMYGSPGIEDWTPSQYDIGGNDYAGSAVEPSRNMYLNAFMGGTELAPEWHPIVVHNPNKHKKSRGHGKPHNHRHTHRDVAEHRDNRKQHKASPSLLSDGTEQVLLVA